MKNCEGCYYEDRPPQEACNLCERDQDGDMTGWVPREKLETAMGDATLSRVASDIERTDKVATRIKTHSAGIIAGGRAGRPCYNIQYYDPVDEEWHIGFGSYDLENVFLWLKNEFNIVHPDNLTGGTSPAPTVWGGEAALADVDANLEENLLLQIEEKQEELELLREDNHLKQLLIEEQREQVGAWREEIDVLRGEREDLRIMLEKAKAEANYYKECLANETRLRELAYAKLDMVHLIFGGGNNA